MAEETTKPGGTGQAGSQAMRAPKLRYQDRPEVGEVFTDSIRSCVFDGQVMRIEFTVARFDDPGALGVLEGRQVGDVGTAPEAHLRDVRGNRDRVRAAVHRE